MKSKLSITSPGPVRAMALLAMALWAWSVPAALAQDTGYVGLEQRLTAAQLREVGLTAEQIVLLDRYLRESSSAVSPTVSPAATAGEGSAGEGQHGAGLLGLQDEPIRSRLEGSVAGWEPGTVFKLQNGQQWKVLKGRMKLRKPYDAPEVVVVPGIAGRWFLQVDEDLPKARVYRVD